MRAWLALCFAGCATVQLPPAPAPPQQLPVVELPPPPPAGFGRLVLGTTGGAARVEEILGEARIPMGRGAVATEIKRTLGTTPCVIDLAHGAHDLELTSLADDRSQDRLRFEIRGGTTNAYVRTLSYRDRRDGLKTAGIVLLTFGAALAVTAIAPAALGRATPAEALGIPGAILAFAGIPFLATARGVEREGAAAQWPLDR
jgi:hypothetical protein